MPIVKNATHNFLKLRREIISRSEGDLWSDARGEWRLVNVFFAEEPQTCLCGHNPIIECCVLYNAQTGAEAIVGNVCVNRFLNLPSAKLFPAFDRIRRDPERALNAAAIEFAFDRGWINDWEREFYLDTRTKRLLSDRQLSKRVEINRGVLSKLGATRKAVSI